MSVLSATQRTPFWSPGSNAKQHMMKEEGRAGEEEEEAEAEEGLFKAKALNEEGPERDSTTSAYKGGGNLNTFVITANVMHGFGV